MKRTLNLLGYWLWIGFAGGAIILLWVATPIEAWLKENGTPRAKVDFAMAGIALGWVAASFAAAWIVGSRLRTTRIRIAAHACGVVLCAIVFNIFLQAGAGFFSSARADEEQVGRFLFGPYPDEKIAERLQNEGYVGIIALLNSVVPFEAVLLEDERAIAAAAGLELIEVPMLPWVSDNKASLARLRELAKSGTGRYYVHCYLGRHRVDLARTTLLDAQGLSSNRRKEFPSELERGPVTRISENVFAGPYPTDEEWFHAIGRTGVRHVVVTLNDKKWIDRAKVAALDLDIQVHVPENREAAKELINSLDGRVYVIEEVIGMSSPNK